jgi:hypothetical protein
MWPLLRYPVVDLPCLRFRMHVQKFQTLVFLEQSTLGVTNFQATPGLLSMRSAGLCWVVLVKFHGAYDYS